MQMGMTYDEFWYGDGDRLKAYKQAYDMKRKALNQEMWINGVYTYKAISTAILNTINGKNEKYFEKPLQIFPKTKEEIEAEAEEERRKIVEHFNRIMKEWKK